MLNSYAWNHLTVCKQMSSNLLRNQVTYKLFVYKSYIKTWFAVKQPIRIDMSQNTN